MVIAHNGRQGVTLHLTSQEFAMLKEVQAPRTTDGTSHNCMAHSRRERLNKMIDDIRGTWK